MSKTKLIAAYARLDTPDLAERIFNRINEYIATANLDTLPGLQFMGRHTGTLVIDKGGHLYEYDFVYPLLSMCRLDGKGVLSADSRKIEERVAVWREDLHTPQEYDDELGYDDEHFDVSELLDDDVNEYHSKCYMAEIDSFIKSEDLDYIDHDRRLTEIDEICRGQRKDSCDQDDDSESLEQILPFIDEDLCEVEPIVWTNPDCEEEMEEWFKEMEERPPFSEYISWFASGKFGPLPDDFDALANEGEPGYYSEEDLGIV